MSVFALLGAQALVAQESEPLRITRSKIGTVAEKPETAKPKTPWIDLTGKWKPCSFGGEGEVKIDDGVITMDYGDPLTGVRWEGPFEDAAKAPENEVRIGRTAPISRAKTAPAVKPVDQATSALPRDNYEIRWECRREKGFDFLCAFTFPVGPQHASVVMGGWGGGITGISSIDGHDASENDTTMFKAFDNETWYKARLRVDSKKLTFWVDGVELFDQPRQDHKFDIRFEMDPCTPLGIANFQCESQIRKIQLRRLHPSEIPPTTDQ